ncbi:MAG: sodium/proline symporter PutP [Clostridiales bacterium]
MNFSVLTTFVIYFIFMFGIGIYFYTKSNDLSDYILGGRSLNGWVAALSAQASDMSGWLLLGLPGAAFASGLSAAWIAFGLLVGTYINWKFIARRLRIYTEFAGDSITIPDFLENRFRDKSKILRVVSAAFILFFFLIYTSSGFVAGATLFENVFHLNYQIALLIGAIIVISYTFLGGYLAVSWTDFFQGILMFCAIIIVPIAGVVTLGGFNETASVITSNNQHMLSFFKDSSGNSLAVIGIISSLAWGMGYFGQPHILVRFMGIRSGNEVKKARKIAMIWVSLTLLGAIFVGLIGSVLVPEINDPETVFMTLVNLTFHPVIAGILLAAILAAVMSTADSQLLVTASAVSEDFYKVLFRKNASDKELLIISRLTVIIIAVIAYLIARNPNNSVMGLVSYAWAGFGATFGPIIIFSLYWKGINRNGAIAGLIFGGITTIIFKSFNTGLYEIIPGFIMAMIFCVIVSIVTGGPTKEISDEFDAVTSKY